LGRSGKRWKVVRSVGEAELVAGLLVPKLPDSRRWCWKFSEVNMPIMIAIRNRRRLLCTARYEARHSHGRKAVAVLAINANNFGFVKRRVV
jgi:hypothetical protein